MSSADAWPYVEFPPVIPRQERSVRLFLCGDVMTGRGIDQVMPHPCDPILYESYVRSAADYVDLAERANGPIPRSGPPDYIWGDALDELEQQRPHARIVNLETSITRSGDAADKGINYRMSPENAVCLSAAKIDCTALANNHVLDWGSAGLIDTLATLEHLRIRTSGAGRTASQAASPAIVELGPQSRLLVFSCASRTSGAPADWAATDQGPGVNLLEDSAAAASQLARGIMRIKRPGDIVVVSIHWGHNWGYDISDEQRQFAHIVTEQAGVSVVHGHSSHHPKAIEIHDGALILYGCGDFLNDYEGISGCESYRADLALMYFVDINAADGRVASVLLVPLQIRRFTLHHASGADAAWLQKTLDRESRRFATRVNLAPGGRRLNVVREAAVVSGRLLETKRSGILASPPGRYALRRRRESKVRFSHQRIHAAKKK